MSILGTEICAPTTQETVSHLCQIWIYRKYFKGADEIEQIHETHILLFFFVNHVSRK
jgi:hypothetical protein